MWRVKKGVAWPLVREDRRDERWGSLAKGGTNGFILILCLIAWWWKEGKGTVAAEVESFMEDVEWALDQMLICLRKKEE